MGVGDTRKIICVSLKPRIGLGRLYNENLFTGPCYRRHENDCLSKFCGMADLSSTTLVTKVRGYGNGCARYSTEKSKVRKRISRL